MAEREPSVLKPTAPGKKGRGDRDAAGADTRAPTAAVVRRSGPENEARTVVSEASPTADVDADTVIDENAPGDATARAETEIDHSRDDTVDAASEGLDDMPTGVDPARGRPARARENRGSGEDDDGSMSQAETVIRPRKPIPGRAGGPRDSGAVPDPVGPAGTLPMAGATALESPTARRAHPTPDGAESPSSSSLERAAVSRGSAPTFYVGGFWRRLVAAGIDLAVILPVSMLLGWIAGALSGVHLPASRHRGLDFWLDLLLASDPALIGGLGLTLAIAITYALIFQVTTSRTLGMRVMKLRIIDVYGDEPSTVRSVVRTAGYLAGAATLGLGFFWIGFDSEKRGIQDWVAGTYVVRE